MSHHAHLNTELSSTDGVYETEETEAGGLIINLFPRHSTKPSAEDAEAEDDITSDASAQPVDNLPDATNEKQDAADHGARLKSVGSM